MGCPPGPLYCDISSKQAKASIEPIGSLSCLTWGLFVSSGSQIMQPSMSVHSACPAALGNWHCACMHTVTLSMPSGSHWYNHYDTLLFSERLR